MRKNVFVCVCVLTDFSVQLNTGEYTLARSFFLKRYKINKIKRQTDEHHTKIMKERNEGFI